MIPTIFRSKYVVSVAIGYRHWDIFSIRPYTLLPGERFRTIYHDIWYTNCVIS